MYHKTCEETYRCLVDVVHVGGGRVVAAGPAAWLRGKRYCPAQGRTLASSREGFIAGAWGCLVPPRADQSPLHSRLHKCVSVYVCHSANLSQSQGSDKNATALRGAYFGMEWRGVTVAGRCVVISRDEAGETLDIPLDPNW